MCYFNLINDYNAVNESIAKIYFSLYFLPEYQNYLKIIVRLYILVYQILKLIIMI
jgi:hypothetical protein